MTPPLSKRNQADLIKEAKLRRASLKSAKMILAALAIALIIIVFSWPYLRAIRFYFPDTLAAERFRYSKLDLKNKFILKPQLLGSGENSYTLSAESARQISEDVVKLTKISGRLFSKKGDTFFILANEADMSLGLQKTAHLRGDVNFISSIQDLELWTEKADIDFKRATITGNVPVKGDGAYGILEAKNGFFYDQKNGFIRLNGPAEVMVL